MLLFFDLDILKKEAKGNPLLMMKALDTYINKLKGIKGATLSKSLYGNSYLLNPELLITSNNIDVLYKVQYLTLAAKRDYTLYKLYKYKGLQLSYYPDIKLESLKHNPILTITKQDIKFKFEELING